jgi:hypothetical protein
VALSEWHLAPEYVTDQWSPEILWLMFRERSREIQRIREARRESERHFEMDEYDERNVISDVELFKRMGIKTTRA